MPTLEEMRKKEEDKNKKLALREQMNQPAIEPTKSMVPPPSQVEERKNIKQLGQTAAIAATPFDFDIKKALKASVIKDIAAQKEFKEARSDIEDTYKEALADYKETKDSAAWGRIAERLGQALTQLGAGAYGMKHGVDMSGLKFDKADWSAGVKDSLEALKIAKEETAEKLKAGEAREGKVLSKLAELRKMEKEDRPEAERLLTAKERKEGELLDARIVHEKAKTKALEEKATKEIAKAKAGPQGDFQKAYKRELGKELADWKVRGEAVANQHLEKLDNAIDSLASGEAWTGGFVGHVPQDVRTTLASLLDITGVAEGAGKELEAGVSLELDLASIIQTSLKETLGGQFAQKEGEDVLRRSFSSKLAPATLMRNAKRLQKWTKVAIQKKNQMFEEMAAGKALYTPEQINKATAEVFESEMAKDDPKFAQHIREQRTTREKPTEIRRKTKDGRVAIFDSKTKEFLRYEDK
jgi:hypothetical protein